MSRRKIEWLPDEQQVMENGFDAYMAKPINANQLGTQISAILKQHIIFM